MSDNFQLDFEQTRPNNSKDITREELELYFEESRKSRRDILGLVEDLSSSVIEVKQSVIEVNRSLTTFKESTADLVTVFNSLQGLSNILVWLGKIMKPLIWIAGIITVTYSFFHTVKIPKVNS